MTFRKPDDEATYAAYFALSDGAYRLDDAARQWCVRSRSDGRLPADVLHTLTPARDRRTRLKYLAELEQSRLWIALPAKGIPGWYIPSVLESNWTAAQEAAYRKQQSENGQKGAAARYAGRNHGLLLVPIPAAESQ